MDIEGNCTSAEFLDKEMTDEIVVVGKVAHVHDLGRTPDEGSGSIGNIMIGWCHRLRGRGRKDGGKR